MLLSSGPLVNTQGEGLGFIITLTDISERKRAEEESKRLQETIQEERDRLSAVLDSITDEVWFADAQKKFALANPAALREFGFDSIENGIEVENFASSLDVFNTDGSPRPVEEAPPLRALGGEVVKNEEEIVRTPASGDLRYRQVSSTPVHNARGEIIGSVSVVRDVTEVKRAERKLFETNQRLQALMQALPVGVSFSDDPTCQRIIGNPAVLAQFEVTVEDNLSASAPDARATGRQVRFFRNGRPITDVELPLQRAVAENREIQPMELEVVLPSGRQWFTEASGAPIRDMNGAVIGGVAVTIDITPRKQMEEEVRKSRDELEMRVRERTNILNERVKEVTCLYTIYDLIVEPEISLGKKLESIIRVIPSGFQSPETTCARITLAGRKYETDGCIQTDVKLTSGIMVNGVRTGTIEVFCRDEKEAEEAFPDEKKDFIRTIALQVGEMIERVTAREELVESEKQLRYLSVELLTAQENERKRIAGEIHDSLGGALSALKFTVERVLQMEDIKETPSYNVLSSLIQRIQECIEEARRVQMDLRPPLLDDLGILPTLEWFVREFQATYSDIIVDKQIDIEEVDIPVPLKMMIFRISQEALNNISKYGKASLVNLALRKTAGRIELTIRDNGQGFDVPLAVSQREPGKGLGLLSMRERAELSGGTFILESGKGMGTLIRASWPV